jgi:lipocalin
VQYYILTQNPKFKEVLEWLDRHGQWYEVHLNRTRFTVESGRLVTEFMLRYSEYIDTVDPTLDLFTGLPLQDIYTGPAVLI